MCQLIASAERCAHGTCLAAATAAAEEMVRVAVMTVGSGLLAIHVPKGYLAMIVQSRAQTRNIAADTGTAEQMENAYATLHLVGLIVYPALMPTDWRVAMWRVLQMRLAVGRDDVSQMAHVRVFPSSIAPGSGILW